MTLKLLVNLLQSSHKVVIVGFLLVKLRYIESHSLAYFSDPVVPDRRLWISPSPPREEVFSGCKRRCSLYSKFSPFLRAALILLVSAPCSSNWAQWVAWDLATVFLVFLSFFKRLAFISQSPLELLSLSPLKYEIFLKFFFCLWLSLCSVSLKQLHLQAMSSRLHVVFSHCIQLLFNTELQLHWLPFHFEGPLYLSSSRAFTKLHSRQLPWVLSHTPTKFEVNWMSEKIIGQTDGQTKISLFNTRILFILLDDV